MKKPYHVLSITAISASLAIPPIAAPTPVSAAEAIPDQLVYEYEDGQFFIIGYDEYLDTLFEEPSSENLANLIRGKVPAAFGIEGIYVHYADYQDLLFENEEAEEPLSGPELVGLALEDEETHVPAENVSDYKFLVGFTDKGIPIFAEKAAVTSVNAVNGKVTVHFDKEITAVGADDFTIMQQIDDGKAIAVKISKIEQSKDKKSVVITIPAIKATQEEQNVVISVSYKNGQAKAAEAFKVAADSAAPIITAETKVDVLYDKQKFTFHVQDDNITLDDIIVKQDEKVLKVTAEEEADTYSVKLNKVNGDSQTLTIDVKDAVGNEAEQKKVTLVDKAKPTITSIEALDNKRIQIIYNEKVSKEGAEQIENYTLFYVAKNRTIPLEALTGGGKAEATLQADEKTVIITLNGTISGDGFINDGLTNGKYILYVDNSNSIKVADTAGNTIIANSNREFQGTTEVSTAAAFISSVLYSKTEQKLILSFSEPVKDNTGDILTSKLTLKGDNGSVVLTKASYVAGGLNHTAKSVILDLSTLSSSDLTKVRGLSGELKLAAAEGAFTDLNNRQTEAKTYPVKQIPSVTEAKYDMESNMLTLTFDKDLKQSTAAGLGEIRMAGVVLKDEGIANLSVSGKKASIQLTELAADGANRADRYQAIEGAIEEQEDVTAYIPADLFTDLSGIKNMAQTIDVEIVQDKTAPEIEEVSLIDLAAGSGILQFSFDEKVSNASGDIAASEIEFFNQSGELLGALNDDGPLKNGASEVLGAATYTKTLMVDLSKLPGNKLSTALSNAAAEGIEVRIGKGALKDVNGVEIEKITKDVNIFSSKRPTQYSVYAVNYRTIHLEFLTADGKLAQMDKESVENKAAYKVTSADGKAAEIKSAQYDGTKVILTLEKDLDNQSDYDFTLLQNFKNVTGLDVIIGPGKDISTVTQRVTTKEPQVTKAEIVDVDKNGIVNAGDTLTVTFNKALDTRKIDLDAFKEGERTAENENFGPTAFNGGAVNFSSAHFLDNQTVEFVLEEDGKDGDVNDFSSGPDAEAVRETFFDVTQFNIFKDHLGQKASPASEDEGESPIAITVKEASTPPTIRTVKVYNTNSVDGINSGDTVLITFDSPSPLHIDGVSQFDFTGGFTTAEIQQAGDRTIVLTIADPKDLKIGSTIDMAANSKSIYNINKSAVPNEGKKVESGEIIAKPDGFKVNNGLLILPDTLEITGVKPGSAIHVFAPNTGAHVAGAIASDGKASFNFGVSIASRTFTVVYVDEEGVTQVTTITFAIG